MLEQKIVRFPNTHNRAVSPSQLYELMIVSLQRYRSLDYICAPVTSSISSEDESLPIQDRKMLNRNRAISHLITLATHGEFHPDGILLPVEVGNPMRKTKEGETIPWGEREYNTLMMMFLLGIPVSHTKQFEQALLLSEDDTQLMNNYQQTYTQRERSYLAFEDVVVSFALGVSLQPMPMIVMPESPTSFGCRMESRVADRLGLPTSDLEYRRRKPVLVKRI